MIVVRRKNENAEIESVHEELLRTAIKLAYKENTQTKIKHPDDAHPHPLWTDIYSKLPNAESHFSNSGVNVTKAKEELIRWTLSLMPTGQLGFLFNRYEKSDLNIDNCKMVIFDLDGVADETLYLLASQMAFLKIARVINPKKVSPSIKKIIFIDEFGTYVNGTGAVADLNRSNIELNIKTIRKLNGRMIGLTNNIDDFSSNPAGVKFWELCSTKIFLPLGDLFPSAKKAFGGSSSKFDEGDWSIMESLVSETEKYRRSSAYIHSTSNSFNGRLSVYFPLSPYMDALLTTTPEQKEFYNSLISNGRATEDAIIEMSKQHPYGEGLQK